MKTWLDVIRYPASPKERLQKMMEMLNDINSMYDNLFRFDNGYRAMINTSFTSIAVPSCGGSFVKEPDVPYIASDKVLTKMEQDQQNISFIVGTMRYLNKDLTDAERAVIASKYFHAVDRKQIMQRYELTNNWNYYRTLEIAEEKLIELWGLDAYGDMDESNVILSQAVRDKRREDRTGIKGGYMQEHPEWKWQFYNKEGKNGL